MATTATTQETPAQELARLRAENERLKAQAISRSPFGLKVSEKGAVSVMGFGRWPVTLYAEQWERLLPKASEILAFIEANRAVLSTKATPKA